MIITHRNKQGTIVAVRVCGSAGEFDYKVKSDDVYSADMTHKFVKAVRFYSKRYNCGAELQTFISDICTISSKQKLKTEYDWHELTNKRYSYNGKSLKIVDCHPISKFNNDIVATLSYDHKSKTVIFIALGTHTEVLSAVDVEYID